MMLALRSFEKMSVGSLLSGVNEGQPVGQVEVREGIADLFCLFHYNCLAASATFIIALICHEESSGENGKANAKASELLGTRPQTRHDTIAVSCQNGKSATDIAHMCVCGIYTTCAAQSIASR